MSRKKKALFLLIRGSGRALPAVLGPPLSLVAIGGDSRVDLLWQHPSQAGESPVTDYNIYRSDSGIPVTPGDFLDNIGGTGTEYEDLAVVNGTTYTYIVTAVNNEGESAGSNPDAATPGSVSQPLNLTVGGEGDQQLEITWDAPITLGTGILTHFELFRKAGAAGGVTIGDIQVGGSILPDFDSGGSYVDTGLTNGERYHYAVRAVTTTSTSGLSDEDSGIPLAGPSTPSKPLNLVCTQEGGDDIRLNWNPPAFDGNSLLQAYTVYASAITPVAVVPGNIIGIKTAVTLTHLHTNLLPGQTFYYTVVAKNQAGFASPPADETSCGYAATVPAAPVLNGSAAESSNNLTWTVPAANGSALLYYELFYTSDGSTPTITSPKVGGNLPLSPLSKAHTGLTNGVTYKYRIRAVNGVGAGSLSNIVTLIPIAVPVDTTPPTVAISTTSGQIVSSASFVISGTASDTGGSGLKEVRVNGVLATGLSSWSKTVTLTEGSNTFEATAKDFAGNVNATPNPQITVTLNTSAPVCFITTPSQTVTASSILIEGTANDPGGTGIDNVKVNGTSSGVSGGTAGGTNTANWSKTINLTFGTNIIFATATNGAGTTSSVVQVTITQVGVPSMILSSIGASHCNTPDGSISITGTPSLAGGTLVNFNVWRSATRDGTYTNIANPASFPYVDTPSGTQAAWYYKVGVTTDGGPSALAVDPTLGVRSTTSSGSDPLGISDCVGWYVGDQLAIDNVLTRSGAEEWPDLSGRCNHLHAASAGGGLNPLVENLGGHKIATFGSNRGMFLASSENKTGNSGDLDGVRFATFAILLKSLDNGGAIFDAAGSKLQGSTGEAGGPFPTFGVRYNTISTGQWFQMLFFGSLGASGVKAFITSDVPLVGAGWTLHVGRLNGNHYPRIRYQIFTSGSDFDKTADASLGEWQFYTGTGGAFLAVGPQGPGRRVGSTGVPPSTFDLEPWSGSIAEIVIYKKELSDTQVNNLKNYMGSKYGLSL
jgi:hypothetical protein